MELEEWSVEENKAIFILLTKRSKLEKKKLTEMEGHSRNCDIRIYNMAEQDDELVLALVNGLLTSGVRIAGGD